MARYIDREKMLKYLEENNTADEWIIGQYNADWIYSFIESQPTADVVEVKRGFWEQGDYYDIGDVCSECEYDSRIEPCEYNYCPACGAKMKGGD